MRIVSPLSTIVSGGQTGVDRAALDVARKLGIPHRGWCPHGRVAEDGRIEECYLLEETPSSDVAQRTEWNVRDSDGTLVLTIGAPRDGTVLTIEMAKRYLRPLHMVQIDSLPPQEAFCTWIHENRIQILNIAGPRESHAPGIIYPQSKDLIEMLLVDSAETD